MLDPETLRNRMVAGRYLRGLTQAELSKKFAEYGLGKHDVGRIERGELTMQKSHRAALQELLQLPAAWFLDEDVDALIASDRQPDTREVVRDVLAELGVTTPAPADVIEQEIADAARSASSKPGSSASDVRARDEKRR